MFKKFTVLLSVVTALIFTNCAFVSAAAKLGDTAFIIYENGTEAEPSADEAEYITEPENENSAEAGNSGEDYIEPPGPEVQAEEAAPESETNGQITIYVNGKRVMSEIAPYTSPKGFTMGPVRAVSEAFGFVVEWDDILREVRIKKDDKEIVLYPGRENYMIGEDWSVFDYSDIPAITGDRTFMPVEKLAAVLDVNFNWGEQTFIAEFMSK
ncbi:MAG: copper amine oxidase N-terminal domain-containing protein [Clostridiales bacterium]|jgi:hypothetical protein|nr:copper amine oxidase N-terminal domain-containing protein [Clostridiales bacterium]